MSRWLTTGLLDDREETAMTGTLTSHSSLMKFPRRSLSTTPPTDGEEVKEAVAAKAGEVVEATTEVEAEPAKEKSIFPEFMR